MPRPDTHWATRRLPFVYLMVKWIYSLADLIKLSTQLSWAANLPAPPPPAGAQLGFDQPAPRFSEQRCLPLRSQAL